MTDKAPHGRAAAIRVDKRVLRTSFAAGHASDLVREQTADLTGDAQRAKLVAAQNRPCERCSKPCYG